MVQDLSSRGYWGSWPILQFLELILHWMAHRPESIHIFCIIDLEPYSFLRPWQSPLFIDALVSLLTLGKHHSRVLVAGICSEIKLFVGKESHRIPSFKRTVWSQLLLLSVEASVEYAWIYLFWRILEKCLLQIEIPCELGSELGVVVNWWLCSCIAALSES